MKLPTLYARTSNGNIQTWSILVNGDCFVTTEGIYNGKLTSSKPTVCKGKNIGKANETTPEEQALKEAQARWKKKIEKGYFQNISDIDKETFFEPMLAKSLVDYKDDIKYPVLVSRKIDGLRLIATKKGLTTRNGKPFVSCPHIHEMLLPVFEKRPDIVIDGEVYSDLVPFEKIVSLVRKTKPTQQDIQDSKKLIQFWIFDGVLEDKNADFPTRFGAIESLVSSIVNNPKVFRFVKNYVVNSFEEIDKKHDEFVAEGFEGLMVRNPATPYENKRTKNLLKYKKFIDEEYTIVGILEGTGNRSGMAGKIVLKNYSSRVKPEYDNDTFESGISGGEEWYKELLLNIPAFVGKTATIRYQELTEKMVPRFPVCVTIGREDYE